MQKTKENHQVYWVNQWIPLAIFNSYISLPGGYAYLDHLQKCWQMGMYIYATLGRILFLICPLKFFRPETKLLGHESPIYDGGDHGHPKKWRYEGFFLK